MVPYNAEYLLKDNTPFMFDKREKRLFRVTSDRFVEIKNAIVRAKIVISNAAVINKDKAFEFSQFKELPGVVN